MVVGGIAELAKTDLAMIDDREPKPYDPIDHNEPDATKRLKALLARLRRVSKATWLLVHDEYAHIVAWWVAQGFRVIEPPIDVPVEEAVVVLAWGELPEDATALLRARGLSWRLQTHGFGEA